jgi:hypothetical protein
MVAALAALGLTAFGYYRWTQHQRGLGVRAWVDRYLRDRFGNSLQRVSVHCSDDVLWPVLVGFDDAQTGMRHRLRFSCPGGPSSMRLASEESERVGHAQ